MVNLLAFQEVLLTQSRSVNQNWQLKQAISDAVLSHIRPLKFIHVIDK